MTGHPMPPSWSERLAGQAEQRRLAGRVRRIEAPAGWDFSSNDYLGLARDPRLAEAAREAAVAHGSGSGAARLLRGTTPVHEALEADLARWKGTEACLLFNTGFQLNSTVLPALLQAGDGLFSDALNHASLVDGCRMARLGGASLHIYRHLDLEDLDHKLAMWRAQAPEGALALVATDAVFSMDGDAADLPGLLATCRAHEALLLVDEAHASGLLGDTGAGLAEAQGVKGQIPLHMGTLGKALGSFGAFMACPEALRDHLVNTCRGFIFSTALPPSVAAAAREGVRLAQTEPERRTRSLAHAARLRRGLGLPPQPSAIVPVHIGEDQPAVNAALALQARGFDVRAVRPPTVAPGTCRLRITTGAHLPDEAVDALLEALREILP